MTIDINETSTILVTCANGLTGYLRAEIESLGYTIKSEHFVGLEIDGTQDDAMLLNLHLRTAYNVLYLLKELRCKDPDDLYRQANKMAWEDLISPNEYISVTGRIDTPTIDNTMFASLKLKDAIVDRILQKTGSRPDSGKEKDNVVIQLFWKGPVCKLYLNTSGHKVSDRSYRKMPHMAPLRESLAAAIMMATGYDGTQPLICPMCGSGTLAIEAALLATHRVPGLLRPNFGFMHTLQFDEEAWKDMRADAQKQSKKRGKAEFKPARIIASDRSPWAVDATQRNAKTAGVDHLIETVICDFEETPVPEGEGIIVMNPEYGLRLGEIAELEVTYARIGDWFKQKCSGYNGYIFTGNMDLAKKVGLRTSKRIPFFNASIECRLLKYEMYKGTKKDKA